MSHVTKLDKAKVAIGLDHPFFASILYKRQLVERKDIPTLAVSNRGTIYYNPEFVETLTVPQLVWGLCHEVGHVICQHAIRQGDRDHKKWNYAGDAWINDTLDNCNVGQRIPNTVDMHGAKDKTTEQIYDELPDNPQGGGKGGKGKGQGGSGGGDYMDGDGMGEDIINEGAPLTEYEKQEIEAQTKIDVAEAAQVAKAKGKLPGALAEFVADILNPKTPWHEILERYMTDMAKGDYSWARPNRRFLSQRMYLPSVGRVPKLGEVVIQVDISGSVSREEIAYYNGHLKRIIEQTHPEKVHVIYTDTEVQHHDEFENPEDVQINFYSGGGTHMPAGFDYIDQKGIDPQVFITLTDGYTGFPDSVPCPSIWCISSENITAPDCAGETIHFDMGE